MEHCDHSQDDDDCSSIFTLPFARKDPYSAWAMPSDLEIEDAIPTGYRWGDQFARFLLENPFYAGSGLLHGIVRGMIADRGDVSQHCSIAFFARLEQVIRTGASALIGLPLAEFAETMSDHEERPAN